jgi:hypothetical protein
MAAGRKADRKVGRDADEARREAGRRSLEAAIAAVAMCERVGLKR